MPTLDSHARSAVNNENSLRAATEFHRHLCRKKIHRREDLLILGSLRNTLWRILPNCPSRWIAQTAPVLGRMTGSVDSGMRDSDRRVGPARLSWD